MPNLAQTYQLINNMHMCEGVKQSVLSVCQSVCQSSEKCLNFYIDMVKRFIKLTVAVTL